MSLHHIALIASDEDKTRCFYETLGFSVKERHERPEKNDTMLFMTDSDLILEIFIKADCPSRPSYPEAYGLRHLALKIPDIGTAVRKLKDAGYSPESVRHDSVTGECMTFVLDPDGLPVELHE